MTFWQWMGFAITAAILCMVVGTKQPQMAKLCALMAGVMLLTEALQSASSIQSVFAQITQMGGLNEGYLSTLLKVMGISYAAELASQTCEELGEKGLALKVGLVGKLCIFSLTAPLLLSLLEMILSLVP